MTIVVSTHPAVSVTASYTYTSTHDATGSGCDRWSPVVISITEPTENKREPLDIASLKAERQAELRRWTREALDALRLLLRAPERPPRRRERPAHHWVRFRPNRIGWALGGGWRVTA